MSCPQPHDVGISHGHVHHSEEFQRLEDGNVINVRCNNELIQTTVRGEPFESCNLDNILGDCSDWEVETPIGFVHNDCVYVEV